MRLALYRQVESFISTVGELFCDGMHFGWTLERPGSQYPAMYHRIPAGKYPISIYDSPHFGRPMPLLRVPGHNYIEIHWGNVPSASEGCILVGKQKGKDTIFFTRQAFDEIFPPIQAAVEQSVEGCSIEIFDPPLSNHEEVNEAATAT